MTAYLELLAQLPETHIYVEPLKLAAIVVWFTLWVLFAQWVDKDTVVVNTYRELWNLVALGTGALAVVLGLFVPVFWIGMMLFVVINLTVMIVYVVHRNGLVQPEDTVMTPAHWNRIREQGLFFKKKEGVIEVKERVRLTGADKKVVGIPEDNETRQKYRLAQDLLFESLWRRATRVELTPTPESMKIAFEVDGFPVEGDALSREQGDLLVQYVKQMAGLNLDERRKPQKGEIMVAIGDNKHKTQVRSGGSTAGEHLSLRIIYGEANYKAPDLGFTPKQLELVEAARQEPNGLIVISAPKGEGLTTTVYSLVRTHDRFLQNIQMIEYEPELPIDNVTQKFFDPASQQSFADVLLRLVRADPDVIVLPEVRDRDAAVIAAKAAANKQKVYFGMVANDVFDALRKLIAAIGDKSLVAKGVIAVANQRLVRLLCNECKQAYTPDPSMMRKLNLPADKHLYRVPEPEYDKRGNPIVCQACQGTGYVGRTAVFEWLAIDDGLREVIRNSNSMTDIQNHAMKKGGVGLQAQALQKVLNGQTSIQEVVRAVRGGKSAGKPGPTPKPKSSPRGASGKPAGGQ